MKILVIGGGAREHVIAETLWKSGKIYAVMKNLNPGIARISEEFILRPETEVEVVADFAEKKGIELAVVGPESALQAGVVDALNERGIRAMGPDRAAARIETSKVFMRNLMENYDIPGRVKYRIFDSLEGLKEYIEEVGEVAVKPVGLTGGKGVKVMGKNEQLHGVEEAVKYARQIIDKRIGGEGRVIIEERLIGEELTIQGFCDGKTVVPTPAVQDHPHAFEGDRGPITGGMGSYSQADGLLPFLSGEEYGAAVETMQKTIDAMREEGTPYHGILYGQFVITGEGPKVVEFNARFGDPEAMNILPLLEGDFAEISLDISEGTLTSGKVRFRKKATVCKYVVPEGYGVNSVAGKRLFVDEQAILSTGARYYYASVNETDNGILTTSSRSLGVVGFGDNISQAEHMVEAALKHVSGEAIYVRHDIATPSSLQKRIRHMEEVRRRKKDD